MNHLQKPQIPEAAKVWAPTVKVSVYVKSSAGDAEIISLRHKVTGGTFFLTFTFCIFKIAQKFPRFMHFKEVLWNQVIFMAFGDPPLAQMFTWTEIPNGCPNLNVTLCDSKDDSSYC